MRRFLAIAGMLAAFGMACAQTVPVTATRLQDGNAPANGTISWVPVLSANTPTVYRMPGGGIATPTAVTAPVISGAFNLSSMPDSALTTPANLCWRVTLLTSSGSQVLGTCVQPGASNYWYAGGVDNFDNWQPNIAPLAMISYVPTIPLTGSAQTVPVAASHLQDGNSAASGTIVWLPVLSDGTPTAYRSGAGGVATSTAVTAPVIGGAFNISSMPDSAQTTPLNLCWRVTLVASKGSSLLSPCVQPSAGNYWYAGGVDNFDNWLPTVAPLPTIGYVQSVNGCVGVCTVSTPSAGDSDVTAQTASQGTVNLVGTVPLTGKYRISYYASQHTVCGAGTISVGFTCNWTDPASARSVSSVALTIGPAQAPIAGSIQGVVPIYALASTAITYTSTVTGSCATGGPASYDAHIAVEGIQ